MRDQVVILVIGFVLTSVAGGLITHYFQIRTAERSRKESERQAAANLFDEISRAMDRRLYRMWLLAWGLESGDDERIDRALAEYRVVLAEWNDSLNRNLALTYRYFGEDVWKYMDRAVYEEFASVGRLLEARYRGVKGLARGSLDPVAESRLEGLSTEIYLLSRFMVALIQHGKVGLYQVTANQQWPERPPWERELREGSQGPRVSAWQRDVNLAISSQIEVDGIFGMATKAATMTFQGANGIRTDGVVGNDTRLKMAEVRPEFVPPTW